MKFGLYIIRILTNGCNRSPLDPGDVPPNLDGDPLQPTWGDPPPHGHPVGYSDVRRQPWRQCVQTPRPTAAL